MSRLHAHFLDLAGGQIKRYAWNADGAEGEIGTGSDDFEVVLTPTSGKRLVLFSITVINRTLPKAGGTVGMAHLMWGVGQTGRQTRICNIQSSCAADAPAEIADRGPWHFPFAVPRVANGIDVKLSIWSRATDSQQPTIHLDYVEI